MEDTINSSPESTGGNDGNNYSGVATEYTDNVHCSLVDYSSYSNGNNDANRISGITVEQQLGVDVSLDSKTEPREINKEVDRTTESFKQLPNSIVENKACLDIKQNGDLPVKPMINDCTINNNVELSATLESTCISLTNNSNIDQGDHEFVNMLESENKEINTVEAAGDGSYLDNEIAVSQSVDNFLQHSEYSVETNNEVINAYPTDVQMVAISGNSTTIENIINNSPSEDGDKPNDNISELQFTELLEQMSSICNDEILYDTSATDGSYTLPSNLYNSDNDLSINLNALGDNDSAILSEITDYDRDTMFIRKRQSHQNSDLTEISEDKISINDNGANRELTSVERKTNSSILYEDILDELDTELSYPSVHVASTTVSYTLSPSRQSKKRMVSQTLVGANCDAAVISVDDSISDMNANSVDILEKTITKLQEELIIAHNNLIRHDQEAKNVISEFKQSMLQKLQKSDKNLQVAQKDKESMVMKYAMSEKEVLVQKKAKGEVERKLKDAIREREICLNKLKHMSSDRAMMAEQLEKKVSEINAWHRQNDRLKEELSSRDIKIKWLQNKLQTESDCHQNTRIQLEKALQCAHDFKEEADTLRLEYHQLLESSPPDTPVKQQDNSSEGCAKIPTSSNTSKELGAVKERFYQALDENTTLTRKVQSLEKERLEYEHNLSKVKEQLDEQQHVVADLNNKLKGMDSLHAQLEREYEQISALQNEIERLRLCNTDLQVEMESCRHREGELLEFAERLTSKNVRLQSEHSSIEARLLNLDQDNSSLQQQLTTISEEKMRIIQQYENEQTNRKQETQLLAKKLAEKTREVETISNKLESQITDNHILKKKYTTSIKELTRELQQVRKQNDNVCEGGLNVDSKSLGSRSSSCTSLDTVGVVQPIQGTNNPTVDSTPEFDRQMLIEKIIHVQQVSARKTEKIEFLEEHCQHLLTELRKKNRIIQYYIMREESGALTTSKMDARKAELAQRGGIMASVFSQSPTDGSLTLELSLEINKKLQAVLEDTLLKNIMLKENIDTLGSEITTLTKDRADLTKKLHAKNSK